MPVQLIAGAVQGAGGVEKAAMMGEIQTDFVKYVSRGETDHNEALS